MNVIYHPTILILIVCILEEIMSFQPKFHNSNVEFTLFMKLIVHN